MARGRGFGGSPGVVSASSLSFLVVIYFGTIVSASLLRTVPRLLQPSPPEKPVIEFLRVTPTSPRTETWGLKAFPRRVQTAWLGIWGGSSVASEESEVQDTASGGPELPHLLAFVGEGCTYCERMSQPLHLVEKRTGEKVLRLEVWHNALNYELLQRLDRGRCGGLPFFVNLRTGAFICGATSFRNLLHWAAGLPCNPHEPPPPSTEELEAARRKTS